MAALSNSFLISKRPSLHFSPAGSSVRSAETYLEPRNTTLSFKGTSKPSTLRKALNVQASYSDGGRPSSTSIFVGGFVLGGLIVGTLGCVFAPQITKAVTDTDKKDLIKKLPKFIYDEEKALERQRKKLAQKIDQLNSDIDSMSNQLKSEEPSNEAAVNTEDFEVVV